MSIPKFIFPLVFIGLLTSCSGSKTTDESNAHSTGNVSKTGVIEEDIPYFSMDTLKGMYNGDFGDGFINIIITYINDKKAVGYNIHKGLQRNVSGNVTQTKDEVILTLEEPGDHQFDGVFEIHLSKKDFGGKATWTANDKKYGVKNFKLKKHIVSGDADEDEEEMEKKVVSSTGQITEKNFLEYFSGCGFQDGDFNFTEDGLVTFHYFPDAKYGTYRKQEITIKGTWEFGKKNQVLVNWGKNTYFKKANSPFLIKYDEYGNAFLEIEGHEINPFY